MKALTNIRYCLAIAVNTTIPRISRNDYERPVQVNRSKVNILPPWQNPRTLQML